MVDTQKENEKDGEGSHNQIFMCFYSIADFCQRFAYLNECTAYFRHLHGLMQNIKHYVNVTDVVTLLA